MGSSAMLLVALTCAGLFLTGILCDDDARSGSWDRDCGSLQADIVLVLDESGSIYGPDFTKQLQFVERLVGSFDVQSGRVHVGVLTYGTTVRIISNIGQIRGKNELKAAIRGISQQRGNTRTDEALRRTRVDMFSGAYTRSEVPHIAIVITDGESDYPDRTAYEADLAKRSGLQVFAIGVGTKVIRKELLAIAGGRQDMVYEVTDYSVLERIHQRLVRKTCEVATRAPPTAAPTRRPQNIEGCDDSGRKVDHIWAIPDLADERESAHVISLIRDVTGRLKLSRMHVQVGVTPRICQAGPAIRLRDYDTQAGFNSALAGRQYNTDANTNAHIQYIHSTGLATASGGRKDAVKFGLLVIDRAHGSNLARTLSEARKAKDAGVRLVVIGVGSDVVTPELSAIASTSQDVIRVGSYAELPGARLKVLARLCKGTIGGNNLNELELNELNELSELNELNEMNLVERDLSEYEGNTGGEY